MIKTLDKEYYNKKLERRVGNCKNCGECCKGCKYLDPLTKLCTTYHNRPWYCHKEFPIDEQDQYVFGVKNCGYSFIDLENKKDVNNNNNINNNIKN